MRRVMVSVRIMVAIIMSIVVKVGVGNRSQRVVEMRLGREMNRDVIDVEREQQRGEQKHPPSRLVRRVMAAMRSASASHQWP